MVPMATSTPTNPEKLSPLVVGLLPQHWVGAAPTTFGGATSSTAFGGNYLLHPLNFGVRATGSLKAFLVQAPGLNQSGLQPDLKRTHSGHCQACSTKSCHLLCHMAESSAGLGCVCLITGLDGRRTRTCATKSYCSSAQESHAFLVLLDLCDRNALTLPLVPHLTATLWQVPSCHLCPMR